MQKVFEIKQPIVLLTPLQSTATKWLLTLKARIWNRRAYYLDHLQPDRLLADHIEDAANAVFFYAPAVFHTIIRQIGRAHV